MYQWTFCETGDHPLLHNRRCRDYKCYLPIDTTSLVFEGIKTSYTVSMCNVVLLMERSLEHLKEGINKALRCNEYGGYTRDRWNALSVQLADIYQNGITRQTQNFVFDNYNQLATALSEPDLMAAASNFQHAIDNLTANELVHGITTNIMDIMANGSGDLGLG